MRIKRFLFLASSLFLAFSCITISVAYRVLCISCYRCSSARTADYLQKKRDYLLAAYDMQPVTFVWSFNG